MARFYWIRSTFRASFISAVGLRVKVVGMELEEAMQYTFSLGRHAMNPELISKREMKSLRRDIEAVLLRIEETRRSGTGTGG